MYQNQRKLCVVLLWFFYDSEHDASIVCMKYTSEAKQLNEVTRKKSFAPIHLLQCEHSICTVGATILFTFGSFGRQVATVRNRGSCYHGM